MDYEKEIIAVVPNYWSRGKTKKEARSKLRSYGARSTKGCVFLEVPVGTTVNEMGNVVYWPPEGKTWDDLTPEQVSEYCRYVRLK